MTDTLITTPAARAALAGVIMRAAGSLGDMWIQTEHQSSVKGAYDDAPVIDRDAEGNVLATYGTADGIRACATHSFTYALTQGLALAAANRYLAAGIRPGRIVAGALVSGALHYAADRRRPLKKLADKVNKSGFYAQLAPVCGPFELDQAYHRATEAIIAVAAGRR